MNKFCCEHKWKTNSFIAEALKNITENSEKWPGSWAGKVRAVIPWLSLYDKSCLRDVIKDYEKFMNQAKESLKKVQEEANKCNCLEFEKQRISHLEERLKDKEEFIRWGKEELKKSSDLVEKHFNRI